MMKIEEIRAMVKAAMSAEDAEYQLVEVVRTAVEDAQFECIRIAEDHQSDAASRAGNNACAQVAKAIREVAGLVIRNRKS